MSPWVRCRQQTWQSTTPGSTPCLAISAKRLPWNGVLIAVSWPQLWQVRPAACVLSRYRACLSRPSIISKPYSYDIADVYVAVTRHRAGWL